MCSACQEQMSQCLRQSHAWAPRSTLTVCVYFRPRRVNGLMGHCGPSHSTFMQYMHTLFIDLPVLLCCYFGIIFVCMLTWVEMPVQWTFMVYIHNTKVFPVYCIDTKPAVAIENDSLCSLPGTSDSYRYTKHTFIICRRKITENTLL